jgi:hypothetical protein
VENTYTYIARSADDPSRVVTFTLLDHNLSVGLGSPLEQIERLLPQDEEAGEDEPQFKLWLKPLAVSLLERSTRPFRLANVDADAAGDWLRVRAWFQAGGLRLAPVTLIDGRVDNPEAAQAFVAQLNERKAEVASPALLGLLDYWITWIFAGVLLMALFQNWRRRSED